MIFSPFETGSVHRTYCKLVLVCGTICLLIFVRETFCMFIFLFVNVYIYFSTSESDCFHRNLLHTNFCSWNLLLTDFFFCVPETFCMFISTLLKFTLIFLLVKLILFMELAACWVLFVKLITFCLFSLWSFKIDFSPLETDSVHVTWYVVILVRGTYCVPIFGLWNFLHVDFSLRETCILAYLLVKLIFLWKNPRKNQFKSYTKRKTNI